MSTTAQEADMGTPAGDVGPAAGSWVRRLLHSPAGIIGLTVLLVLSVFALFADVIAPYDPKSIVGAPFSSASTEFLLGTDDLGRDVFSQLVHGSRASFYVGIVAATLSTTLGIVIGAVSGYFGGRIDAILMRISEIFQIVPSLIVALVAAALWGGSLTLVIVVLAVTTWANEARIMRAQVMSLRERDFVNAARVGGFSHRHIVFSDILPNAIPPLIVQAALSVGGSILVEAGLSFIGIGDPNVGSWGQMLNSAQQFLPIAPELSIYPGIAIVLVVLGFNLLADGLNNALNPRAVMVGRSRRLALRLRRAAANVTAGTDAPVRETDALLDVEDLRFWFRVGAEEIKALDGVSLQVNRGECVGVVGESGSGKSTLARVVTRLLPPVEITRLDGSVVLDGKEIMGMSEREMVAHRRNRISMVFQEPMSYLNPTMTVGRQIAEGLPRGLSRAEAAQRVDELLSRVDIPASAGVPDRYPHELSGGQRQRAMIALALALEPQLLIADEPTTALDPTVQAQVLATLRKLNREEGLAIMLITHDLGLVATMCDRVAVMTRGKVVETAPTEQLFTAPAHPYTRSLLDSRPGLRAVRNKVVTR